MGRVGATHVVARETRAVCARVEATTDAPGRGWARRLQGMEEKALRARRGRLLAECHLELLRSVAPLQGEGHHFARPLVLDRTADVLNRLDGLAIDLCKDVAADRERLAVDDD